MSAMKAIVVVALITSIRACAAEWQSMDNAPRDGTIIEIQNNYGIAPWYDIYRYSGKLTIDSCTFQAAKTCVAIEIDGGERWVSASRNGSTLDSKDERYFRWRPYTTAGDYVDPTGGAQRTKEYWCKAAHVKC